MSTQASRVIDAFGNAYALSLALKEIGVRISPSGIYRWVTPKPKGRGGFIPSKYIGAIRSLMATRSVPLTEADLSPIER